MDKLKNKSWYRAIKVLFIITFITTQIYTIKFIYDKFPLVYVNTIECNNGGTVNYKTDDISYKTFLNVKNCLDNKYEILLIHEKGQNSKIYFPPITKTIFFLLLDIFVVTILFRLVKKVFLYIVTGEKIISIKK